MNGGIGGPVSACSGYVAGLVQLLQMRKEAQGRHWTAVSPTEEPQGATEHQSLPQLAEQ